MLHKSNLLALSRFKTLTRLHSQNTDEHVKMPQLNESTPQLSESLAQLNESTAQLTESKN